MPALVLLGVVAAAAAGFGAVVTGERIPGLLRDRRLVAVVALLAATAATRSGAAPTGRPAVDAALVAIVAFLTAQAGRRARRVSWIVSLLVVAVAIGTGAGPALATFAALGAAAATARDVRPGSSRHYRVVGAAVGGVVANAALRLTWPDRFGATAAVAALAIAVLAGSWVGTSRPATRRRALAVGTVLTGVTVLVVVVAAVPVWLVRVDATAAINAGNEAIAAARQGDTRAARDGFDEADALLRQVDRAVGSWWTQPGRAVPVLAQHLDALDDAVDAARQLTSTGADVARTVDIEQIRPRNGRVDVDALAAFEAPLEETARALDAVVTRLAAIDNPWLAGPLTRRVDDVASQVGSARLDNARALEAARALPSLLGKDAQRRWFLAVLTPSELRGGGGLMGNWGILTATDGKLELPVFERLASLYDAAPYRLRVDDEWDARYLERFNLAQYPQNIAASPHFPSTAEALRQVAEQAGLGRIDGVLAVDPYALAALLELTGPATVAGWPEPLTGENAARILLHEQYLEPDDPDRPDFLEAATRAVFDGITGGELPAPPRIADVLGPMARVRRLQVHAFDPDDQTYVASVGVASELAAPVSDALAVVTHNAAPSKLDFFLRRSISYDVTVDEQTGAADAVLEVRLDNLAPPSLPGSYFHFASGGLDPGENEQLVSLYSVLDLQRLTVDGAEVTADRSSERGHRVFDTFVRVPAGSSVVLRYELAGALASPGRYRLDVHRQPTVAPDDLEVTVNGQTRFQSEQRTDVTLRDL